MLVFHYFYPSIHTSLWNTQSHILTRMNNFYVIDNVPWFNAIDDGFVTKIKLDHTFEVINLFMSRHNFFLSRSV